MPAPPPTPREDRQTVGQLIREARVDAGLAQADLAARLSKPQSFVSKVESGERRVDVVELRALCRALGLALEEFVARLERDVSARDTKR